MRIIATSADQVTLKGNILKELDLFTSDVSLTIREAQMRMSKQGLARPKQPLYS